MQKQHERSGEIFQRLLQRKGKGKAIKCKDRRLWCIQYYCKQVAASNKLHCFECLINKIIFFINHCHWGRQTGGKNAGNKPDPLLACMHLHICRNLKINFVCLQNDRIRRNTWLLLTLHVQFMFSLKKAWSLPRQVFGWARGCTFSITLLCLILRGRKGSSREQEKETPIKGKNLKEIPAFKNSSSEAGLVRACF